MRLHLAITRDLELKYLGTKCMTHFVTMTIEETVEKKSHNIMMIDIASPLNYAKFDEVKDCGTIYEMWIKLKAIYGGDDNV